MNNPLFTLHRIFTLYHHEIIDKIVKNIAFFQMFTVYYEWLGVFAVIGMGLYNGQRGSGHKQLFYWFYPAHVYLLYGASCLVYSLLQ